MNILFVDDDKSILRSIARVMFDVEEDWNVEFANSGKEALDKMEEQFYHLVVSDMRMPMMNGAELLSIIKEKYPETIRFILSGYADRELTLKTVHTAEQFLSKPCSSEVLIETIKKAFESNKIVEEDIRDKVSKFKIMPATPKIYFELSNYLEKPDVTVIEVVKIISKDIVITSKVLKIVNSAFFGLRKQINSIEEAIKFLGFDVLKALVLSTEIFNQYKGEKRIKEQVVQMNYQGVKISMLSKLIMKSLELDKNIQNLTYLVGIICNLGKVIFIENDYEDYLKVQDLISNNTDEREAERIIFGITHSEMGAFLIGKWGFEEEIINAVKHAQDKLSIHNNEMKPESAVYIASYLMEQSKENLENNIRIKQILIEKHELNEAYSGYVEEWCKTCLEVIANE